MGIFQYSMPVTMSCKVNDGMLHTSLPPPTPPSYRIAPPTDPSTPSYIYQHLFPLLNFSSALHWRLLNIYTSTTRDYTFSQFIIMNRNLFSFGLFFVIAYAVLSQQPHRSKTKWSEQSYSNVYKCKGYVLATGSIMSNAAATKCRLGVCRSVLATVLGISQRCRIPQRLSEMFW